MKLLLFLLGTIMLVIVTSPEVNATAASDALATSVGEADAEGKAKFVAIPGSVLDELCKALCKGRLPKFLLVLVKPHLPRYRRFCYCDAQKPGHI
ncbi:hypothetical protein X777_06807 [Ooceraea biroi]|uniref:Uncharacterized protein n=1 Tax=Ooceraea biroi TaxID=2015173 RepID=A0A026WCA7_OOCBI|nr:hypothetical protein X777_06807 [Ooceraea biroi]